METKVTQKDLIGDLENFPIEVVEKMLIEQYKHLGKGPLDAKSLVDNAYKYSANHNHFSLTVVPLANVFSNIV